MIDSDERQRQYASILQWGALAAAITIMILTYALMERASATALFLLPVPGLLLIAGGFVRAGDLGYARTCIAIGIYQDAILSLYVLSTYVTPLEVPPPLDWVLVTGGDWLLAIPTSMGAGIAAAVLAARGRVSRAMGLAGILISIAGLGLGAWIISALARSVL